MKIKNFIKTHKKLTITLITTVMIIAVLLSSFFITYAVMFSNKCKLGEKIVKGSVTPYEWSLTDVFNIDDYPSVVVNNNKVKILALTDTHLEVTGWYAQDYWTKNSAVKKAYKHIDTLIKTADPDFIIVTGDILTDPLSDIVMQDFVNFIDAYQIPWTLTFGNHDAEWRADKAALCNIIEKAEHTLFQVGPTNLQGLGNSLVNFKDTNGKIFYSIITMDTGDWQQIDDYKKFFNNMHIDKRDREFSTVNVGYTDEQADWYRWVVEGLRANNGGETVETMVASHVPFKANNYALRLSSEEDFDYNADFKVFGADGGNDYGVDYYKTPEQFADSNTPQEIRDAYDDYAKNYKFFSTVKELGSTKTFISGDIHSYGYSVKYDGITYISVVKTTDIYVSYSWDKGKRGGTYFEISPTPLQDTHLVVNKPWYHKEVKK